jgi:DNA-binding LacI/PurR family transcriptional regulator
MRADMSVPALMDHLRRGRVNGIILPTPLSQSEELLAALRADNIPVVTVAATRNRPDAYSVSIDDYQAARAMTAYLIEMGHRRIGFIKGNPTMDQPNGAISAIWPRWTRRGSAGSRAGRPGALPIAQA